MYPQKVKIETINGEEIEIAVPKPADIKSFFLFSLMKAGSALLNNLFFSVCNEKSIPVIQIDQAIWKESITFNQLNSSTDAALYEAGYAYTGFRIFIPWDTNFDFTKVKSILLIRDPRDMLVSRYFSLKYSHNVPKKQGIAREGYLKERELLSNITIDDYLLKKPRIYLKHFHTYEEKLLINKQTKLYRYEDVISKKREWLTDMLNFLNIELPQEKIFQIADRHDIRPDKEDKHAHIRQVTPGNYKKHLKQKTINKLNKIYSEILSRYGYTDESKTFFSPAMAYENNYTASHTRKTYVPVNPAETEQPKRAGLRLSTSPTTWQAD
jgi:hypothetical protein